MLKIKNKRALEGKNTNFTFNGHPVENKSLERARQRYKRTKEFSEQSPLTVISKSLILLK